MPRKKNVSPLSYVVPDSDILLQCERELRRQWRERHPKAPKHPGGRPVKLSRAAAMAACEKVWPIWKPRVRTKMFTRKGFISDVVRQLYDDHEGTYEESLVREHVDFFLRCQPISEVMGILDRRNPFVKEAAPLMRRVSQFFSDPDKVRAFQNQLQSLQDKLQAFQNLQNRIQQMSPFQVLQSLKKKQERKKRVE